MSARVACMTVFFTGQSRLHRLHIIVISVSLHPTSNKRTCSESFLPSFLPILLSALSKNTYSSPNFLPAIMEVLNLVEPIFWRKWHTGKQSNSKLWSVLQRKITVSSEKRIREGNIYLDLKKEQGVSQVKSRAHKDWLKCIYWLLWVDDSPNLSKFNTLASPLQFISLLLLKKTRLKITVFAWNDVIRGIYQNSLKVNKL